LYVAANTINLRAAPSVDAEVVANLKFGDKVRCRGESPDWLQVTYAGKTVISSQIYQSAYGFQIRQGSRFMLSRPAN